MKRASPRSARDGRIRHAAQTAFQRRAGGGGGKWQWHVMDQANVAWMRTSPDVLWTFNQDTGELLVQRTDTPVWVIDSPDDYAAWKAATTPAPTGAILRSIRYE